MQERHLAEEVRCHDVRRGPLSSTYLESDVAAFSMSDATACG